MCECSVHNAISDLTAADAVSPPLATHKHVQFYIGPPPYRFYIMQYDARKCPTILPLYIAHYGAGPTENLRVCVLLTVALTMKKRRFFNHSMAYDVCPSIRKQLLC